jgi:hypothetical protein
MRVLAAGLCAAGMLAAGFSVPARAVESPAGDPVPVASAVLPSPIVPAAPIPGFGCPPATVTVSTADQLSAALAQAGPGTVIQLANGSYEGNFVAARSGTPLAPVYLCGGPDAVLQSDGIKNGYVLHLDGVSDWRLSGFTVQNGQKGVVVDAGTRNALQNLTVQDIGDEGVHLRSNSTGNVVRGLIVRNTGLHKARYGEGIYVGTAKSNWDSVSGGRPDRSDGNFILGNTISQTTAENVDLKEGTTGGVLAGNRFDGSGLTAADSWVDVKGNGWLIAGNVGRSTPKDGFQTHVVLDGWGDANLFTANRADLDGGTGVGFYLHRQLSNLVACSNAVPAGSRLSNRPCSIL